MMYILLLNHWADMTFHLKDIMYICSVLFIVAGAWFVQKNNTIRIDKLEKNTDIKERISNLEKKYDDVNKNFGNLEVQIAKLRFEIVKDVIYEVRKIFGNKK